MRHAIVTAVLILAVGLFAATVGAQECIEYGTTNPQTVFATVGGSSSAVAVAGDRAYVASSGGVRAFDVSDPAHAAPLGEMAVAGWICDLAVAGDHLFVAACNFNLSLVIAAPTAGAPAPVATVALANGAYGVVVADHLAYVAAGTVGLVILDVADPADPRQVAVVAGAAPIYAVALADGTIFAGCREAGFSVIDVTDPQHPSVTDTLTGLGYVSALGVHDGNLFVGNIEGILRRYDLASPKHPTLLGTLALHDTPTSIASHQGELWFCGMMTGLVRLTVRDGANPAAAGMSVADLVETPGLCYDAAFAGDLAFTAGTPELRVLDLAHPAQDATLGWFTEATVATCIGVAGPRAYVADPLDAALLVVDVSDPVHPVSIGRCALLGDVQEMVLAGDHAFVAAGSAGLLVIDLVDPDHPALVTTLTFDGSVDAIALTGSLLLVGGRERVLVVDVVDWRQPAAVGALTAYNVTDIAANGGLAVAVTNGVPRVIDLAEPTAPAWAGSWQPVGHCTAVALSDSRAYAADLDGTFSVIDLTDPVAPLPLGQCATMPYTSDLARRGNIVYLASDEAGILAVDVADPAHPVYLGAACVAGAPERLAVTADAVYGVCPEYGVVVTAPVCSRSTASVAGHDAAPGRVAAAPNPFNPCTSIRFILDRDTAAALVVSDLRGRVVRRLLAPTALPAGVHECAWDGRDDGGRVQSAGVYIARLLTDGGQSSTKVTLLK